MRYAILFLLFASSAFAQKDKPTLAVMESEPVPHWHCPAGQLPATDHPEDLTLAPVCSRAPSRVNRGFNSDTQELVYWHVSLKIPASGVVRMPYKKGFAQMPGCGDSPHANNGRLDFSDVSINGVTISGKPGITIELDCKGIVAR